MGLLVIVGDSRADEFFGKYPTIKAERSAKIDCEIAAVIVGKGAGLEVSSALGVIADGESFRQKLPRGIQLITCGVSPKNTVSITSRTAEKLTLSLNRSIRTESGKICEPLEQPVNVRNNIDEYDVMAEFAAKMLLEIDNDSGN